MVFGCEGAVSSAEPTNGAVLWVICLRKQEETLPREWVSCVSAQHSTLLPKESSFLCFWWDRRVVHQTRGEFFFWQSCRKMQGTHWRFLVRKCPNTNKIECWLASTTVCWCSVVVEFEGAVCCLVAFGVFCFVVCLVGLVVFFFLNWGLKLELGQMLQSAFKGFDQVWLLLFVSYPAGWGVCWAWDGNEWSCWAQASGGVCRAKL